MIYSRDNILIDTNTETSSVNKGVPECPIQLEEIFQPALKPEFESAWNTKISHMLPLVARKQTILRVNAR